MPTMTAYEFGDRIVRRKHSIKGGEAASPPPASYAMARKNEPDAELPGAPDFRFPHGVRATAGLEGVSRWLHAAPWSLDDRFASTSTRRSSEGSTTTSFGLPPSASSRQCGARCLRGPRERSPDTRNLERPAAVQATFEAHRTHSQAIETTAEATVLAEAYLAARVVPAGSRVDALHVALASVARADAVVSWNFKHLVQLQRIRGFHAVNVLRGYPLIEIRSPLEVVDDEA